jgi:hypothetical protein
VKTCVQCGAPDRQMPDGEHFVQPEIDYLKEGQELTARQLRLGWFDRGIFQARRAIERDICMDCLNVNYIRRQLNSEQRKKALALEKDQSSEDNFYLLLADVDGAY